MKHYTIKGLMLALLLGFSLIACRKEVPQLPQQKEAQEASTPSTYPSEPSPSTLHFSLVYAHHSDFDWGRYRFALKKQRRRLMLPLLRPLPIVERWSSSSVNQP